MKKAISLALVLVVALAITFAFIGVGATAITYADSEPVVYTCTDSDGIDFVVTITDEVKCHVVYGENESDLNYSIADGILTLTNSETGKTLKFTIGDGFKLTEYVDAAAKALEEIKDLKESLDAISDDELSEEVVADTVKNKISDYLEQYATESLVFKIITWLFDIGAIGALVGIYLKYRKYKNTTMGDIEKIATETIEKVLKEKFGEMNGETSTMIQAVNDNVKVLLQAYALSQDKSAEGKIAMLNIIQGCNEDKELDEKIEDMKTEIAESQEAEDEVKEKVADEYVEIF